MGFQLWNKLEEVDNGGDSVPHPVLFRVAILRNSEIFSFVGGSGKKEKGFKNIISIVAGSRRTLRYLNPCGEHRETRGELGAPCGEERDGRGLVLKPLRQICLFLIMPFFLLLFFTLVWGEV